MYLLISENNISENSQRWGLKQQTKTTQSEFFHWNFNSIFQRIEEVGLWGQIGAGDCVSDEIHQQPAGLTAEPEI